MKKLLSSCILAALTFVFSPYGYAQQVKGNGGVSDLYQFLLKNVTYPAKAKAINLQGNSIALFTVNAGKLKDVKVNTELGSGCDLEIINQVLAYPNFKGIKTGKYALKATFKLGEHTSLMKNEQATVPVGYTELKLTIVGQPTALAKQAINGEVMGISVGDTKTKKSGLIIKPSSAAIANNILIVVNGEIIENGALNDINPEVIENITILKNSNALAEYGEKGKNGVIIITTKTADIQKVKTDSKATISITPIMESNQPIIILDGKQMASLQEIDPSNIKELNILKDASAMAQYGEKAKNGVIVITSKNAVTIDIGSSTEKPLINLQQEENQMDVAKTNISIRSSKNGLTNQPMYIVDQKVMDSEELERINVSTIESIKILKDLPSIALYGEAAKNGVIIVTTKNVAVQKQEIQKNK